MNVSTVRDAAQHANERLGRAFFAEQDRLRGGPAEALCATGYSATLGGGPALDRAAHEAFSRAFYAAFPDLEHRIEDVLATAESVVVRFVLHGTHGAEFFGIPATRRSIEVPAHVILHVRAGKVERLLGIFDEAGLLRQLGVLPSP
jgi:steroid delta-isomerase-like uncharacterized protein